MKVLVTSNSHPLYGQVVELTHCAVGEDRKLLWVVLAKDGTTDYLMEGQFQIIKRQEGE